MAFVRGAVDSLLDDHLTDRPRSYFDADSIIMNQEIPLEIFEPPSDYGHINWLAGKDFNGLNAGVFILRVNQWSLNLLNRVMTYKHYHPDEEYTFQEQTILARLTENDSEFSGESIYVPKAWINAYFYSLHEAKPGLLLSHFPHPDYKWHIYEWLRVLEADQQGGYAPVYNKPVQQTDYPDEIKRFWNVKRRADKALKGFERNIHRGADPVMFGLQHEETKPLAEDFRGKYEDLKVSARLKADEVDRLEVLIQQAEEVCPLRLTLSTGELGKLTRFPKVQRAAHPEFDGIFRDSRRSAVSCWVLGRSVRA